MKKKSLTLNEFQKKFPHMNERWLHHFPFKKAKAKKFIRFSQNWYGKAILSCCARHDEVCEVWQRVQEVKTFKRTGFYSTK